MIKNILLFSAVSLMGLAILTSGQNGAGAEKGYNATGSETGLGNINGCKASGCHGSTATPGITVAVELDSAGSPVTQYRAGITYTVKITGTNTTANSLPDFGFQVSCIKGSVAVATPVNAGAFATTGLPTNVRYTAAQPSNFVCNVIEHSNPISATTGGGATGSTYIESFPWTAPATGTGTISFWGAVCAVNNDTHSTGDFWNTNMLIINEFPGELSVAKETNNLDVIAFPNPVTNSLNISLNSATPGTYSVKAFDIIGRVVTSQNILVSTSTSTLYINTAAWASGTYHVAIEKDGIRKVIPVVKN